MKILKIDVCEHLTKIPVRRTIELCGKHALFHKVMVIVDYAYKKTERRISMTTNKLEIFSAGQNVKIAENTAILNLPPITTCTNCSTCAGSCYAKFRYQYPNVKKRWDRNLEVTKRSDFVELATNELRYKGTPIVRFHESGDFFDKEYIEKCRQLALKNPQISFYGYTKNKDALILNELINVNIIYSLIDTPYGELRNYGTAEYCEYLHENYNIMICPHDETWKTSGKKCMVDCTECLKADNVCFVEHGRQRKSDKYSDKVLSQVK